MLKERFFILLERVLQLCSIGFILLISLLSQPSSAASIKLAWDPGTGADLAGYRIYYGTSPRTGADPKSCSLCGYSTMVPAGNVTTYTVNNLSNGQTYYFSVTAYDTSNNESGFSNEASGAVTDPTQTYTYTVATNPTSLQIMVDGTTYDGQQTFNWTSGSSHTISVSSPQGGTGSLYIFTSWSDGGTQNHTVTVPSASTTYTANFKTQYSLTSSANPSGGGTVNPSGVNWYDSGQSVSVTATANAGYSFSGWAGDLTGSTNPASLTLSGPRGVTANFTATSETVSVPKTPTGSTSGVTGTSYSYSARGSTSSLGHTVQYQFDWKGDGTDLSAWGSATQSKTWAVAGTYQVRARAHCTTDTGVVSNWSNALSVGISQATVGSLVVTPSTDLSASGIQGGLFNPASQTYTLQNKGGIPIKWRVSKKPRWVTVSSMNGHLAPGETVQVTVSLSNIAKQLKRGSYNDTIVLSNVANVNDSQSRSMTLLIAPPIKTFIVKTNPDGLHIVVDGIAYTSPQTFQWEVGSSHILDAPSPQTSSPGARYAFSSWSNLKSQNQTTRASSFGTTYTANFKTQYALTTSVNSSEEGIVTPAGTNWFNQGRRVSVTARPNKGYQFINWSGDVLRNNNSVNLVMQGPMNLVANFGQKGSPGGNKAASSTVLSNGKLPMIGELESPSEGKRVFGIKTIYGWVLDGEGISRLRLFIDGEYICDIPYGGLREDLKETYPDYPDARKGGFALILNYSSLSPGPHLVQIEVQNVKGEVLNFSANIIVLERSGEIITQVNPSEWLIPGINLTVDGNTKTYDLRLEWSTESQSFEIIELNPQ